MVHPLPIEPAITFLLRFLPGVEHTHRHPRIFFQHRVLNHQSVLDRKETGLFKIISFFLGIIRQQKIDVRMAERRPGFRRYAGIDLPRDEQIVKLGALRRDFELAAKMAVASHRSFLPNWRPK